MTQFFCWFVKKKTFPHRSDVTMNWSFDETNDTLKYNVTWWSDSFCSTNCDVYAVALYERCEMIDASLSLSLFHCEIEEQQIYRPKLLHTHRDYVSPMRNAEFQTKCEHLLYSFTLHWHTFASHIPLIRSICAFTYVFVYHDSFTLFTPFPWNCSGKTFTVPIQWNACTIFAFWNRIRNGRVPWRFRYITIWHVFFLLRMYVRSLPLK